MSPICHWERHERNNCNETAPARKNIPRQKDEGAGCIGSGAFVVRLHYQPIATSSVCGCVQETSLE
jgi:hypothetical protein